MSSPYWFYHHLCQHLSSQQLKQAEAFLYAESWMSPSACYRQWSDQSIPLRYRLDIDVNEQS